jgi:hypothetical protein
MGGRPSAPAVQTLAASSGGDAGADAASLPTVQSSGDAPLVVASGRRRALRLGVVRRRTYLSSTLAPAPSSFFLMSSASAFDTPSLTAFGAPSTRSLASLEAQAGDRADFLDDVDLVVAELGEDHVELGLLLSRSGGGSRRAGSGNHRDRSGGGNAPLLFEQLRELGGLENGELRELVHELGERSAIFSFVFLFGSNRGGR